MKTLAVLAWLTLLPTVAFGQSALAGLVIDPLGEPVPEVGVEAVSGSLIEGARATVTDAAGRYRLDNLRPGTYSVRFTLEGWKPYEVHDVELIGPLTVVVNARLTAGAIAETITVAVERRAIDVQSATRAITLTSDVIRSLPVARSYNALLVLVPGIVTSVNDVVTGPATTAFPLHGGRQNEGRLLLNGLTVGSPPSGNSATTYDVDVGSAQEVTFTTSGGLGESETAGLVMNIVPRAGGNTRHGSAMASGTSERLQASGVTPALSAQGVTAAPPLSKVYDFSGTFGGPIITDRLWHFLTAHSGGSTRRSANVYYNRNAGNAAEWLYAPDTRRPSYSDRTFESASGRLTWQLTPRNTVSGFWDAQTLCRACTGATPGLSEPQRVAPEAVGVLGRRLDATQATWFSPLTDHLLFEAGYGGTFFGVGNFEREPNPTRDLIRIVEQCARGCAANGNIPGLVYRSQDFSVAHTGSYLWRAVASYITGTHALKAGYQHTLMTDDRTWMTNDHGLMYRLDNGVPTQLTQSISPWVNDTRAAWQAFFLQPEWTVRRLTIHGAVRFDRSWSWFPRQQEGPSRFLPTPIVVPETRGIHSYKDVTPRLAVAYDFAGTGRTAIKMSIGRYLEGVGISGLYASTNPTLRMPRTTPVFGTAGVTRAWTDANRNFVANCDLLNPNAQDLRAIGGDACGVLSNVDFGRNVMTNAFDAALLDGWGVRPSDWNVALTLQHQAASGLAVDVTYSRRSFRGFTVADNLSLDADDLTPFSLVAPLDARLPGGGGYVVHGLYDVVPGKAGRVDNLIRGSEAYGRWFQYFNGLDVTVNGKVGGFTFAGGTSTGQTVADNCDARAHLPELATTTTGTSPFGAGLASSTVSPLSPYCHVAFGVLTQARGLASYLVPSVDLHVAATFQSKPGPLLAADYAAPNEAVSPSLGRNLSGGAASVSVNLVPPGSLYGERVNQLDLRVAKVLTYGRSRTAVAVEVYNLLDANTVLTYNNAFVPGGPWLQPVTLLTPRLFKLTAEFDW
jgi:hypothetical protein